MPPRLNRPRIKKIRNDRALYNDVNTSHLCNNRRTIPFLGATIGGHVTPLTTATNPSLAADGSIVFTGFGPYTVVLPCEGFGEYSQRKNFRIGRFSALVEVSAATSVLSFSPSGSSVFYTHTTPDGGPPAIFSSTLGFEYDSPGLYQAEQIPFGFLAFYAITDQFTVPTHMAIDVFIDFGVVILRSAWVEFCVFDNRL